MALILGTAKNDTLFSNSSADVISALAGDDWIVVNKGNHEVSGGSGVDTLSFMPMTSGVYMNLGNTGWQDTGKGWMKISSVENMVGSNFSDHLTGNSSANRLAGWGGNDILRGMGGKDVIRGGLGNDTFDGGLGTDAASFASTETKGIKLDLRKTGAQNTNEGLDTFISIENIYGSQKNDNFIGNDKVNEISGGAGNDRIDSGNNNDKVWGGAGNDTFIWQAQQWGVDVIGDFEKGKDKIDLDSFSTKTGFDFNDLTITHVGGDTQILLNNDPCFQISLSTFVNLTASDFIF